MPQIMLFYQKVPVEFHTNIMMDYYADSNATFQDVADKWGISKERVRQIVAKEIRIARFLIGRDLGKKLNF